MISETHMAWLVHRARDGAASDTVEDAIHWGTAGGRANARASTGSARSRSGRRLI